MPSRRLPLPRRSAALLGALLGLLGCRPEPHSPAVSQAAAERWPAPLVDLARRARDTFDAPTLDPSTVDLGAYTLVDVREARESAVSILHGARTLPTPEARQAFLEQARAEPPDRPVLVYCTAGWRSADFTHSLDEAGIPAFNLEGGICAWAADGHPIETPDGQPTRRIHAFSSDFAECVPDDHEAVTD